MCASPAGNIRRCSNARIMVSNVHSASTVILHWSSRARHGGTGMRILGWRHLARRQNRSETFFVDLSPAFIQAQHAREVFVGAVIAESHSAIDDLGIAKVAGRRPRKTRSVVCPFVWGHQGRRRYLLSISKIILRGSAPCIDIVDVGVHRCRACRIAVFAQELGIKGAIGEDLLWKDDLRTTCNVCSHHSLAYCRHSSWKLCRRGPEPDACASLGLESQNDCKYEVHGDHRDVNCLVGCQEATTAEPDHLGICDSFSQISESLATHPHSAMAGHGPQGSPCGMQTLGSSRWVELAVSVQPST